MYMSELAFFFETELEEDTCLLKWDRAGVRFELYKDE